MENDMQRRRVGLVTKGAGAALLAACAWAAAAHSSGESSSAVAANPSHPATAVSSVDGFQPSRYPLVSVKFAPRANPQPGASGSVYVVPGAARPRSVRRVSTKPKITLRRGLSRAGGNIVVIDKSLQPTETLVVGPSGKTQLQCSNEQPSALSKK